MILLSQLPIYLIFCFCSILPSQWIFHPAPGLRDSFQIESVALPGAYLSPAVGANGDTEGSQAVIIFNSTNTVPSYTIQAHTLGGLLCVTGSYKPSSFNLRLF